jgi:hypothetical protein
MYNKGFAIGFAAMMLAGAFGLAATAANAESVMKECGADWKAAKAAGTTNGQTWNEFLKTCEAQKKGAAAPAAAATPTPAAAPAPAPAAAPAPAPAAAPAPAMTPAAAAPATPKPKKSAAAMAAPAAATGAGEFAAEAEAKAHCPSDTVVWVNTKSHKYHFSGHKSYGTTKQGAYMCEADAKAAGNEAAKGEQPK